MRTLKQFYNSCQYQNYVQYKVYLTACLGTSIWFFRDQYWQPPLVRLKQLSCIGLGMLQWIKCAYYYHKALAAFVCRPLCFARICFQRHRATCRSTKACPWTANICATFGKGLVVESVSLGGAPLRIWPIVASPRAKYPPESCNCGE